MKTYKKWAKHHYSFGQRMILMILAGLVFLLLLPTLLVNCSARLDAAWNLPDFSAGLVNKIAGAILSLAGFSLGFWSVERQITLAAGTPVPVMPTQKLIVQPPFTYCRNPMTLGTILGYSGIGVWIGSFSAVGMVLLFGLLLILYIKLLEEKELEARFGESYLEYKRQTPFMLPRFRRKG